jgi:hypothetical protein
MHLPSQFTRPFTIDRIQKEFQTDPRKILLMYTNMFPEETVSITAPISVQQKRRKIIQQMKKKFQRQMRKIKWDKKWIDFMQSFCLEGSSPIPDTEDDLIEALKTCLPKSLKIISFFTYDRIIMLCKEALEIYSPTAFNSKLQTRVLKKILALQPYNYFFLRALKNRFHSVILENFAQQDRVSMQKDLRKKTISTSEFISQLLANMDTLDAAELENDMDSFLKVIQLILPEIRNKEEMLALF